MSRTYRRFYDRYRLPDAELIPCEGLNRPLTGHVAVLSLGGMLVRTKEAYETGTFITVRFEAQEGAVQTLAVVRYQAPGGLGMEFVGLRGVSDDNLRKILDRLSMTQEAVS